jgi:hypothetical protein
MEYVFDVNKLRNDPQIEGLFKRITSWAKDSFKWRNIS